MTQLFHFTIKLFYSISGNKRTSFTIFASQSGHDGSAAKLNVSLIQPGQSSFVQAQTFVSTSGGLSF